MYHPKKCNTIYHIRSKYVVPVISAIPVHHGASNDGQLDCLLNSLFSLKQIKPKSSHYSPYVSGIYSPHKGPIKWKSFPCHHIIVTCLINDHGRVWYAIMSRYHITSSNERKQQRNIYQGMILWYTRYIREQNICGMKYLILLITDKSLHILVQCKRINCQQHFDC